MGSLLVGCSKFMGLNYGLLLSAWGFAGLIGPIIVARGKDLTGSFAGLLPFIAIVLSISVILPYVTKKPPAQPARPTRRTSPMINEASTCSHLKN